MSTVTASKPYSVLSGEGLADVWWMSGRLTVKASGADTGDAFAQFVTDDPRETAPPVHLHHNEDVPGVPGNAPATLVAVWSPYAALVLFPALSFFYVVGSSLFHGDKRRVRSPRSYRGAPW